MRLAIRDSLLVGATVLDLPEDTADIDVLIAYFFDGLDPVVGDIHGHAVVEAIATVLELGSQSRHARHLLGNGDGVGIYLVDEFVGKRQIADGIVVLVAVEVVENTELYGKANRNDPLSQEI